jgi:hypothetical protein
LDEIVLRCLAKSPEQRFPSAHDLRIALSEVLQLLNRSVPSPISADIA